jgi:hypothetical protein
VSPLSNLEREPADEWRKWNMRWVGGSLLGGKFQTYAFDSIPYADRRFALPNHELVSILANCIAVWSLAQTCKFYTIGKTRYLEKHETDQNCTLPSSPFYFSRRVKSALDPSNVYFLHDWQIVYLEFVCDTFPVWQTPFAKGLTPQAPLLSRISGISFKQASIGNEFQNLEWK